MGAHGSRARLGAHPGLVARVCAWLCVDSAQLLQPIMVMDLPSGLVCAISSWPLVAFACPCGAHCSMAVGSYAMPCKCQTRLGVRYPFLDFKGRKSNSVLQPDLPGGGWPEPVWHFWRSYHLICHESTFCGSRLLRPALVLVLFRFPHCIFKAGHRSCLLSYFPA